MPCKAPRLNRGSLAQVHGLKYTTYASPSHIWAMQLHPPHRYFCWHSSHRIAQLSISSTTSTTLEQKIISTMVIPLFGWSAGDVVTSINILKAVAAAFKKATGAEKQYSETSSWLDSFASDLKRINEYTAANPTAKCTRNILEHVGKIDAHYLEFESYLQKYDRALSSDANPNAVISAMKKINWGWKELKETVASLKATVNGPLLSIHLLILLQSQ